MSGDSELLESELLKAAQGGLCGACACAKLVKSARGSLFLLCTHPELPKYPNVPVMRCAGFTRISRAD